MEFVGASVNSRLIPAPAQTIRNARLENPHVKFFDVRPGNYARCGSNEERRRSGFRLVEPALHAVAGRYERPVRRGERAPGGGARVVLPAARPRAWHTPSVRPPRELSALCLC